MDARAGFSRPTDYRESVRGPAASAWLRDFRSHPPGTLRTQLKYGCHEHRKSGTCENNWYIRQDRVEDQLLSAIEERVFNRIDPVVKRCEEEVWRWPMAFGGRGGNSR